MEKMIGQPQYIKEVNINIIEDIIAEKGPVSKPELSRISSLSLPTVNKIVDALTETDRVKVSGVLESGIGRKAQLYVVNANSGCILALYLMDHTYICAVVNAVGEITYRFTVLVETSSRQLALESTYEAIDNLIAHANSSVKAIGIGVPGVVKSNNLITNIPNIQGWEGINLKEVIEGKYKLSTFVENNVKLTTVGFYHNELKQRYDNIAYIHLGKGIGSGIIIDKKLYKGFRSLAGELGYMIVEGPTAADMKFVKSRGLLEQRISNLIQSLKDSSGTDESKKRDMEKLQELLSFGLTNLIYTLNPEVIVLSGDIISRQFISEVEIKVRMLVDTESLPVFMSNDSKATGIAGIVNMCVSSISSKFRLLKGRGM